MNSILFILACGLLVLIVASKIPGLDLIVKPIIDMVFTMIKVVAANASYWVVWLTKLLISSHSDLVQHLVLSAEQLDPSHAIRDKEA